MNQTFTTYITVLIDVGIPGIYVRQAKIMYSYDFLKQYINAVNTATTYYTL